MIKCEWQVGKIWNLLWKLAHVEYWNYWEDSWATVFTAEAAFDAQMTSTMINYS